MSPPDGSSDGSSLAGLEARLGYRFRRRDLLERALTHSSHAHEAGASASDNEALEFLGDAVLSFLVSERIFRREPTAPEGVMSRTKAWVVADTNLALVAERIGLGRHLQLGVGEERSGGRQKPSLLAGALEALLAAVFLDGGVREARNLVEVLLGRQLDRAAPMSAPEDPKTALQELLQGNGQPPPSYRVVEATGPDHQKQFRVQALLEGRLLGEGCGASKKAAEQKAARQALDGLSGSTG